jgi:hypothetical protein
VSSGFPFTTSFGDAEALVDGLSFDVTTAFDSQPNIVTATDISRRVYPESLIPILVVAVVMTLALVVLAWRRSSQFKITDSYSSSWS